MREEDRCHSLLVPCTLMGTGFIAHSWQAGYGLVEQERGQVTSGWMPALAHNAGGLYLEPSRPLACCLATL